VKKCLAFVLGGGGARGALQAGALKALLEAGYQPDLMVGSSIGAVNASFLALRGVNLDSVNELIDVWKEASQANLLPHNYLSLTLRALLKRRTDYTVHRLREFFIQHGLTPDLCFGDIRDLRLILVSADLNTGKPVLYGPNPQDSILEGVLASTALPPWVPPLELAGRLLVDGGAVSILPIEAAIQAGASEIIALDLTDPRPSLPSSHEMVTLLEKIVSTANQRQTQLEITLAEARRIPVKHISLKGKDPMAIWDFVVAEKCIAQGYELTRSAIASWTPKRRSRFNFWRRRDNRRMDGKERDEVENSMRAD
jgi:NTE family protein